MLDNLTFLRFVIDKRHIGYAVNSLSRRISRVMDSIPAIKENKNLTGIQIWVLNFLFRSAEKDVYQRDVEREFNIRRSTGGGLIRREPVDFDARLKKIVLTEYAEDIRKQLQAQIKRTEAQMTEGFTDEEIETFFSFVERFKNKLKKCE